MKTEIPQFAVLATDVVLFTYQNNVLKVCLLNINNNYFHKMKALPGGLILPAETAENSVARHMRDKAGVDIKNTHIEQLYSFSKINRDPRGRVVSVAYLALLPSEKIKYREGVEWVEVKKLPKLAYDHSEIVKTAIERLKSKIKYTNIAYSILPISFRLTEMQNVYEAILGQELDKRNFRKKILESGLLEETGKKETDGAYRPAKLYRFKNREIKFLD
jgi:8-oxo-dGTP diphosphatase